MFRGKWEVVPGRHCELGRGLCSSQQARCLFPRHQTERVDQEGDRNLKRIKWREEEEFGAGRAA